MKINEIRALLHATQQEMADFLGISRSHYSMFESGQRDLPLKATQLLAALLTKVQLPKILAKSASQKATKPQQIKVREYVKRLLKENEFRQLKVERRIAVVTKKHETNVKRLLLRDFLDEEPDDSSIEEKMIHLIIKGASEAVKGDRTAELLKLEVRQELLAVEKKLLESKLDTLAG